MHSKDIIPVNADGQFDGYCETYWETGELAWQGVYVNGERNGYIVSYYKDGTVIKGWSGYWMNGDRINNDNNKGYCYTWNTKPIL